MFSIFPTDRKSACDTVVWILNKWQDKQEHLRLYATHVTPSASIEETHVVNLHRSILFYTMDSLWFIQDMWLEVRILTKLKTQTLCRATAQVIIHLGPLPLIVLPKNPQQHNNDQHFSTMDSSLSFQWVKTANESSISTITTYELRVESVVRNLYMNN